MLMIDCSSAINRLEVIDMKHFYGLSGANMYFVQARHAHSYNEDILSYFYPDHSRNSTSARSDLVVWQCRGCGPVILLSRDISHAVVSDFVAF